MPNRPWAAARMRAETGDDFVEHQHDAGTFGQLAQLPQEFDRLEIRPPALHRLDDDGGQRVGALPAGSRAIPECRSRAPACSATTRAVIPGAAGMVLQLARAAHDHFIEDAVIRASEDCDRAAPGDRSAMRIAPITASEPVLQNAARSRARHFAEESRSLACQHVLRADLVARVDLPMQRFAQEIRLPAEQAHAEARQDVDVLVAVDVPHDDCRASARSRADRSTPWSADESR